MPTGVRLVGAADRARLRGVAPGELGLRWGTGGRKGCGLGEEAEAGEPAAGEVGIGDEGHDGAATAAGALENVLGEHPGAGARPMTAGEGATRRAGHQGATRRRGWAAWPRGSLGEWHRRGR
jgi:hypothetical protein